MTIKASLILLVLAAGAALASPDADQLDLSRGLFVALGAENDGHRPCRATCEGKPLAEGYNNECFGLLKVFCGPPPVTPGEPPKHELMGAACQGHWRSLAVNVPSAADGEPVPSLVTVCEGGHRWMASKMSTCPHTNHTTKKLMGVLSLGEIITVMSVSGADAALLAPHVRPDLAATHQATEVLAELQRWNLPRSAPAATKVQEATRSFSIESKHHGFKVEWQATKRVPPSSSPALEETFETLDDEAKETMGPSWRDWLPSGPPPPEQHGNGTFELLCNGKPAWLHGAVPCHGNFTVAATRTSSSSASSAAPGDKKPCGGKKMLPGGHGDKTMGPHAHHASLRRLLASPLHLVEPGATTSSMRMVEAGQHVPATKGKLGTAHTSYMKAECDGLWTGLLGHTCFGVSTSHLEVTEEVEKAAKSGTTKAVKADDDDDEDEGDVRALAKWSVCSGHQSIRFVHRDMTFGMAVSCKGASVVSLNMTVPWHA